MEDNTSPLILRRRLRTQLVAARLRRDLTQQQVAEAMDWSLSKMNRIASAKSGISTNDLKVLLSLYEITDQELVVQLLALARGAKQSPWWRSYSDVVSSELLDLVNYESASSAISRFESTCVPEILQTEEYASAVLQVFNDENSAERVDRLVKFRTERRRLLATENAPEFYFVLDESVIRRLVGSHAVMRQQLQHLVSVGELPNVRIQVVPFTAGVHGGMKGAFEVVQFEGTSEENVVFLEGPRDFIIIDIPDESRHYLGIFGRIAEMALDPEASVDFLEVAGNSA